MFDFIMPHSQINFSRAPIRVRNRMYAYFTVIIFVSRINYKRVKSDPGAGIIYYNTTGSLVRRQTLKIPIGAENVSVVPLII